MKSSEQWKPSKFVYRKGKLRASRDAKEVGISSRFVADIVARHYDEHLSTHISGRLIDLGCGKAPLYGAYKALATECICADWESSFHKNPYLDLICDLNKTLPVSSEEFNTIILSDVLEHLVKPQELWHEMFRILKPGGKVILNVPFFYKIHEAPHDYFRYTRFALQNFATSSGFNVVMLREMGGLPEILTDLVSKFIYNIPLIGSFLASSLQKVSAIFMRTSAWKKLVSKTQDRYPLGYFMIVEKP